MDANKQYEERKEEFKDKNLWGKISLIVTYQNGKPVHEKVISEVDLKVNSSLKNNTGAGQEKG